MVDNWENPILVVPDWRQKTPNYVEISKVLSGKWNIMSLKRSTYVDLTGMCYHKLLLNFLSWQCVAVREKLFIKSTKIAVYLEPDRVARKEGQVKPNNIHTWLEFSSLSSCIKMGMESRIKSNNLQIYRHSCFNFQWLEPLQNTVLPKKSSRPVSIL